MVGRDGELARLEGALADAADLHGRTVVIGGEAGIVLDVRDYGDRYPLSPQGPAPGRHRLLESAVAHASAGIPRTTGVEIAVWSAVPPGSSVGTSAAVVVALLAALEALTPSRGRAGELARAAHAVANSLGVESRHHFFLERQRRVDINNEVLPKCREVVFHSRELRLPVEAHQLGAAMRVHDRPGRGAQDRQDALLHRVGVRIELARDNSVEVPRRARRRAATWWPSRYRPAPMAASR